LVSREEKLMKQRLRQARYMDRLDRRGEPTAAELGAALLHAFLSATREKDWTFPQFTEAFLNRLAAAGYDMAATTARLKRIRRSRRSSWSSLLPEGL
jgi:hypothetical protein